MNPRNRDSLLRRGKRHVHLRYRMYRCLRSRGWSRGRAAAYAVRNPKSFEALAEAIAIQKARRHA